MARVPEHIVQGNLRRARELFLADLAIRDRPASRIQSSDDSTCTTTVSFGQPHLTIERTLELSRGHDLNCHDGFEDDGLCLVVDLTESTDDSQAEGKLG